ncbi:DUF551 domain-containing protein [Pasteurella oralis]|uniref:DUF551 domain-containing protein n=1 Tax=Pasteurella oralis TaxID=1071947 RepID=A0ABW4NW49_9PAST
MTETENKYFSIDICNNNSISFHSSKEEARKECLNCAEELHQQCVDDQDMQFYENCVDSAVYGLVLGKVESKTRELNEEEKQSGLYGGIDYIVEKPEIVEYQKDDGWISVKDRLPQPIDTSTEYRNQENKSVIYYTEDDEYWFIGFGWYVYGDKEDCDGYLIPYWELEDTGLTEVDVTHWQPLPPPPTE